MIVIGSGLAGITSAYYLNSNGCRVTVLDRAPGPAKETSFAKAALHFHTELIAAYEARDRNQVQQLMTDHICDARGIISEREALLDNTVFLTPEVDTPWRSRLSGNDSHLDDYLERVSSK